MQRLNHLDLLKFFAICSVILGHCTEQTTGNDFWTNPIWSTIYSFHMPLFMMICGYFFASSLRRPFWEMLRLKSVQLLVPCVTLTAAIYGIEALTGFNPYPEFFARDFTSVANVLWFLKCVLLCYITAYVAIKLLRSMLVAAIVTSLLFTLLPGADVVNFNFLLPMFWLGYALRVNALWIDEHRPALLTLSAAAFAIMLCFWSGLLTVYAVPIAIVDWHTLTFDPYNCGVALLRFGIGAAGSLTFFLVAPAADRLASTWRLYPTILAIGRMTLGIYVVQIIVVECGVHALGIYASTAQSLVIAPLLAIAGIAICFVCVSLIRLSPAASLLLLGENRPKPSRQALLEES